MITKLLLKKSKFFPLVLIWLFSNIAPLAIFILRYNDISDLKPDINILLFIIAIYLFVFGLNYVIGAFTLAIEGSENIPGARQSILYLFSIVRTGIVIIILTVVGYIFDIDLQIVGILLIALECGIAIFQIIRKISINRKL